MKLRRRLPILWSPVNEGYMAAWLEGDEDAMADYWAQGRELTGQGLEAFAAAQQALLSLMYERPIVPHEARRRT